MSTDPRRHSPAAERNGAPILAELQRLLGATGALLEIASGSGEHAARFAAALPGWQWQPTDVDPGALASIDVWCAGLRNVRPAARLDVLDTGAAPPMPPPTGGDRTALAPTSAQAQAQAPAPAPASASALTPSPSKSPTPTASASARVDAVYCANLIHIAPWTACTALMQLASARLVPGGRLLLYGPFIVDGEPTAAGNLAFDADLRARDPAWGLRRLAEVDAAARAAGLVLDERIAMPANNRLIVWRKAA